MSNALNSLEATFRNASTYVIGSGPSLAYKRMDFLKNFPTISANLGFLMFENWGFEPSATIFSDKDVLLNNIDLYKKFLYGSNSFKILTGRAAQEAPSEIIDDRTIVLPQVKPVGEIGFEPTPSTQGFYRGNTVIFNAIQLLYELESQTVNILGMDLSTNVNWGTTGHAFEIQRPEGIEVDFGFRYKEAIKKGLPSNPHQRQDLETSFELARVHYEKNGRKLINDLSSSLEALEKKDLLNEYVKQPFISAVVPAKSTSSRIPVKNIKNLGGKPLYLHVVDMLLNCNALNHVVLDTDSEDVARFLDDRPVQWLKRPEEYANNQTDGNKLFTYEARQIDCDILLQVLPTAPLLRSETIDNLLYQVVRDDTHDSAFAVLRKPAYLWKDGKPFNYDLSAIPNSVDLEPLTIECMSAYAVQRDIALQRGMRFGFNPHLYPIAESEAIDIDTAEDFLIAEAMLKARLLQ